MITAVEALALPTAQLTEEEKTAADDLERLIDEHVRKGLQHRGVDLDISCTNGNVLSAVTHRLIEAGWIAEWTPITKQHALYRNRIEHVGFKLSLRPSVKAYQDAAKLSLH